MNSKLNYFPVSLPQAVFFFLIFVSLFPSLSSKAKISHQELLTITENSFALYWETDFPQLCSVTYGTNRIHLSQSRSESSGPKRFHYLEVNGLMADTLYYYQIICGEEKSTPSFRSPGKARTLKLPEDRELFRFAVLTDMHLNEEVAGLILLPGARRASLIPGFSWKDPNNPYWSFTNQNAIERINFLKPDFTIVNGDLTSWFTEEEFILAKKMLDKLQMPYYPLRGNHDRVENQPQDSFLKIFQLPQSYYSFVQKGFLFICLDSIRLKDGFEEISPEEWTWFENTLKENKSVPTFIFTHYQIGIGAPGINKTDREKFLFILKENPQIIACFYGHQHGAKIRLQKFGERVVPQVIVPTAKEYPSGFGLVRIFRWGLVYNFYATNCDDCLEWRSITRKEYYGLAPWFNGGALEDRNLVFFFPFEIQSQLK